MGQAVYGKKARDVAECAEGFAMGEIAGRFESAYIRVLTPPAQFSKPECVEKGCATRPKFRGCRNRPSMAVFPYFHWNGPCANQELQAIHVHSTEKRFSM